MHTAQTPAEKVGLMRPIVGDEVEETVLIGFLVGAGGDIDTAINHYFAASPTDPRLIPTQSQKEKNSDFRSSSISNNGVGGSRSGSINPLGADALRQAAERKLATARKWTESSGGG
jgi:hypothetical protein